jgi:hypothetical protein
LKPLPAGSSRRNFVEPTAFTDGQDFLGKENVKAVAVKWRSTTVSQNYQPRLPTGRRGFSLAHRLYSMGRAAAGEDARVIGKLL